MASAIKIIDVFRNRHIPERFLNSTSQSTLDMFENQICVCLRAEVNIYSFNSSSQDVEDEIRAEFMGKLYSWIKDFPTTDAWSVVSHGTTKSVVDGSHDSHVCTLGFVFADFADSEDFIKHFLLLEKLAS